jgi:hypothetical protein
MVKRHLETLEKYDKMMLHRDYIFYHMCNQLQLPHIPELYSNWDALQALLERAINVEAPAFLNK